MSVTDLYASAVEPPDDRSYGDSAGTRVPPQDLHAEQSVLGAMLLSKDAIDSAVDVLRGSHFYQPAHEAIFEAILDLSNKGEPADAITVSAELQRRGELTKVGGPPYLHTLVSSVPIASNAEYYADIVREKAILRGLVTVGTRIAQMGYAEQGEIDDLVNQAQAEVFAVAEGRTSEDFVELTKVMGATIDELEAIESRTGELYGVPSGLAELDKFTTGFHSGQMIVVAARPGVGKSTLGLDFCRNASIKHGLTTAIFSLEMNRVEIAMRLLSAEARVSLGHMRSGELSSREWQDIATRTAAVSEAPLIIDDSPNMTMTEIRSKARRIKQRFGLDFMVIDYLQLMTSGKRVENRQVEVSEFSRQIKLLAKELEIPIVAISQLNRGSEQSSDKRPQLSQLRESGSIEQDADIVLLLHRPDLYEKESERPGEADIIVAKNRSGRTGDAQAVFQGHYSRFVEMARDAAPGGAGAEPY
ncbi:MAG: dnaB [Nocardioidaceae bacterium]|nr:dnaB [Nocardioidaceae bacterium]